jgi:parvulin-like peptidyl-prolyl isomerase
MPAAAAESLGQLQLDRSLVAEVERASGLPSERALELVTEDAVLAAYLSRDNPALASWVERIALARALLRVLGAEAQAQGPPRDDEVGELSERRWWELDRPRMVQIAHAVVRSSEENPAARALAERIAAHVATAKTSEEFQELAKAVSGDGLSVKVEQLAPVAPDGRAVDPDRAPPNGPPVQNLDGVFVEAAQRLERPGQLSPVVRTRFGYHVLYLVRVIEPHQPTLAERRQLLHDEVMEQRGRRLQSELLEQQRRQLAPEQARSALSSMERLGTPP